MGLLFLLAVTGAVQAGRPLGTDDAGTAGAGRCQVEAWHDRSTGSDAARAWTLAPACGLGVAVELGLELRRTSPVAASGENPAAGLALKWVDPGWKLSGGWGEVGVGLKAATGAARDAHGRWHAGSPSLLALASWKAGEAATLHLNLGDAYDRDVRRHRAVGKLAGVWQPADAGLLFAEVQAERGQGGALRSLGGRWWLLPERLGLDLTASRAAGAGGPTLWSLGLGWYGLGD